jgi:hypothetical protein
MPLFSLFLSLFPVFGLMAPQSMVDKPFLQHIFNECNNRKPEQSQTILSPERYLRYHGDGLDPLFGSEKEDEVFVMMNSIGQYGMRHCCLYVSISQ